jgi:hypothetical protein
MALLSRKSKYGFGTPVSPSMVVKEEFDFDLDSTSSSSPLSSSPGKQGGGGVSFATSEVIIVDEIEELKKQVQVLRIWHPDNLSDPTAGPSTTSYKSFRASGLTTAEEVCKFLKGKLLITNELADQFYLYVVVDDCTYNSPTRMTLEDLYFPTGLF